MKRTAVIMAGGSGERFWPMSRKKKPKQLLPLLSDKMLIEESIDRISPLINKEDIFIITSPLLLEPLRKALPGLPPDNIVAEPFKRNTAPALALSAAFIAERYSGAYSFSDISVAVLTADQNIHPVEGFVKTVSGIMDLVEKEPLLATIGIQPDRPDTGYGYIEVEEPFSASMDDVEIKRVIRFREKPAYEQAVKYVSSGNYLWNSGMFFWRLDTFINSMEKHLPEVGDLIDDMMIRYGGKTSLALPGPNESIADIFLAFPDISIDYGLMEKAQNVVVAKALFFWDDVGSWDSLERVKEKDENGNIIEGATALAETENSIIINKSTGNKMVVGGVGLENMIVIVTDDAVLICPKNRVQDVKKSVEILKKNNSDGWL